MHFSMHGVIGGRVSVAAHNSNHPDPQTYQMRERRADIPLLVQH